MTLSKIFLSFLFIYLATAVVDRTYYTYLGLDISATPHDIEQAYAVKKEKILAIQVEQERENKMKLLEEAYQVLRNNEKKSIYDRLNKDLFLKSAVVANLKKLTDQNNRKGKKMELTLPVSVEDVFHGKTVEASFFKQVACSKCKGTGAESPKFLTSCSGCAGNGFAVFEGVNHFGQKFANENTCNTCKGWGKQITKNCPVCQGRKVVTKVENVKIKIPKGLPDGNIIKIPNFGDEPIVGAPSDLEVKIVEIPTSHWSRQGEDLIYTLEISLKESIFGFTKKFLHLSDEEIEVERSEVTTQHSVMTIPNKGIENVKTKRHGKLLIKFKIVIPEFNDKQLDMWEDFFKIHKL